MRQEDLLVGLDIGTSKMLCLVAKPKASGFDVIGVGEAPSRGMRKGSVIHIDETVESITAAVAKAEDDSGVSVEEAVVGIAGAYVSCRNSRGAMPVREREVKAADVVSVLETAKAMPIPDDQQILHVLSQEFILDGQDNIQEPVGMRGVRLEVKVHIVTAATAPTENIVNCVKRCGIEVQDIVLQPIASAMSVLSEDEKALGVCLVDIGGGTTDLAVYASGIILHTAVIPVAGDHVTNDISVALRTPLREAEKLKHESGHAWAEAVPPEEKVLVPGVRGVNPGQVSRRYLAEVVSMRMEELLKLVRNELHRANLHSCLAAGVVLTGGSSLLPGMETLGEKVFEMPVRVGLPVYQGPKSEVVCSPRYSTGMGLLHMARRHWEKKPKQGKILSFGQIYAKMRRWFQDNF